MSTAVSEQALQWNDFREGFLAGKKKASGLSKLIKSHTFYKGPIFEIHRDTLIEPGDVKVTRDVIVHSKSVVVMPVFRDGRILLIRQYRYAARSFLWELVAGRVDKGEAPLAAARRELREETGYAAKSFRKLFDFFPSPGMLTENMIIYAAEGLKEGAAEPEEDERITPEIFTLDQAEEMIRSGKIRDAKTIAGVLYYRRFVAK